MARLAAGQDAVASATGPRRDHGEDPEDSLLGAARGLAEGLRRAGVRRLVVVGGAGSLEVAPGQRLLTRPDFPPAWKPTALAHARALDEVYRGIEDLDWTYVSPAGASARASGPGNSGSAGTSCWSTSPARAGSASPTSRSRSPTSSRTARRSAAGSPLPTEPGF